MNRIEFNFDFLFSNSASSIKTLPDRVLSYLKNLAASHVLYAVKHSWSCLNILTLGATDGGGSDDELTKGAVAPLIFFKKEIVRKFCFKNWKHKEIFTLKLEAPPPKKTEV